ncbi:hypothetical protein [Streptomyces sp. NPDC058382]
MRPIRDETVNGGRSLGEETAAAAIKYGDRNAMAHVVRYCGDAGFETLIR